ncbi:hypothetical protein ACOMHN_054934 [Nucella lapillus]
MVVWVFHQHGGGGGGEMVVWVFHQHGGGGGREMVVWVFHQHGGGGGGEMVVWVFQHGGGGGGEMVVWVFQHGGGGGGKMVVWVFQHGGGGGGEMVVWVFQHGGGGGGEMVVWVFQHVRGRCGDGAGTVRGRCGNGAGSVRGQCGDGTRTGWGQCGFVSAMQCHCAERERERGGIREVKPGLVTRQFTPSSAVCRSIPERKALTSGQGAVGDGTADRQSPVAIDHGDSIHRATGHTSYTVFTRNEQEENGFLRMRKRQKLLSDFCSSRSDRASGDVVSGDSLFRTNVMVSTHRPLLYCPVGKAASTFITRFLVAAEETHPVESPYVISPQKAVRMRSKRTGSYILFAPLSSVVEAEGVEERRFLESVTRVVFVRCPFERLWSAYVDKLMLPNPHYWHTWGLPALREFPNTPHTAGADWSSAKDCGQSVSFPQFLSFAVSRLHKTDTHVRPVARDCAPCDVSYDVIGHVETLRSDVLYLTSLLRLNNATLTAMDWGEGRARDAIREGVREVLVDRVSQITRCMALEDAAKRLWRVLQIRGVISRQTDFPHTLSGPSVTSSAVEAALLKARSESSGMKEALAEQKNAAFLAAYHGVSRRLKNKIRQAYAEDFQMFGFDKKQYL